VKGTLSGVDLYIENHQMVGDASFELATPAV
jgi:hypothetical protein